MEVKKLIKSFAGQYFKEGDLFNYFGEDTYFGETGHKLEHQKSRATIFIDDVTYKQHFTDDKKEEKVDSIKTASVDKTAESDAPVTTKFTRIMEISNVVLIKIGSIGKDDVYYVVKNRYGDANKIIAGNTFTTYLSKYDNLHILHIDSITEKDVLDTIYKGISKAFSI
jgi:hypothetical protein